MARSNTTFSDKAPRPGPGRPPGRGNLVDREIKALACTMSVEATKKLQSLMRNSENEFVQLAAANAILDRAIGKPRQAVELTGEDGGPIQVSATDARNRLKLVLDSVAAAIAPPSDFEPTHE